MIDELKTPEADETAQAAAETAPDQTPEGTDPIPTVPLPAAESEGPAEPAAETEVAVAATESAATHEPESEPAPAPVADAAPREEAAPRDEAADRDLFESYMSSLEATDLEDGGYKRLNRNDRVEATVVQVEDDRIFVDLGTKSEGIVPLGELADGNVESAKDVVKIGDKIKVVVLRPEGGGDSNPIVSKKRADFEAAWDHIEEAYRTQEMITAQVIDRVKGGLVVDVGVRGFVPATHVGNGKLRNIEKYVGQALQLKVLEIDRERRKVVLSNREAEEARRVEAKESIFRNVKPGDVLEGTVRRLADYGAFVDLGGVDGLLHISEMSWVRINHPKEMFKEGQKIKVMVLRLDQANGKISLGHRQVLPDPWNLIKENYKIGQKLTVTIGRLVQSGAFVRLPEGAEAFLPVSEMSFRRVKRPQDVVEENQEVEVQILDLRPDERRMVLSMRATGSLPASAQGGDMGGGSEYEDFRNADKRRAAGLGGKKAGKKSRGGRDDFDDLDEVSGRRGFATGGATIGERLGALRGLLTRDEDEESEEDKVAEEPAEE
jgi:4-hydroxy-3-methylbut-2-enyl diphosphate reductase